MPEAMFSTRRTRDGKRRIRSNSVIVAGGTLGLGIGLAMREEILQPTFFDLLDAPHQFWIYLCDGKEGEEEKGTSVMGIASVAIGMVTMIGGQSIGLRGFVEGVMHVTNVLADENARKWGVPVLGALASAGPAAYFILELPSSVPRIVDRRIHHSLVDPAGGSRPQEELFVNVHAARVARETRKVLRLASWDLRERFRVALDERSREVQGVEETERRAICAKEWFAVVGQRTAEIRDLTGLLLSLS
jgi:mitofusin